MQAPERALDVITVHFSVSDLVAVWSGSICVCESPSSFSPSTTCSFCSKSKITIIPIFPSYRCCTQAYCTAHVKTCWTPHSRANHQVLVASSENMSTELQDLPGEGSNAQEIVIAETDPIHALAPTDEGPAAWKFLFGSFLIESLLWGSHTGH